MESQPEFDVLITASEAELQERHQRARRRFSCGFSALAVVSVVVLTGVWVIYRITAPPPSNFYGDDYPFPSLAIQLDEDGSAHISNPPQIPFMGTCTQTGSPRGDSTEIDGHWMRTWPAIIVVTAETGESYSLIAHAHRGAPDWDRVALDVCMPDGTIDTVWLWSFANA